MDKNDIIWGGRKDDEIETYSDICKAKLKDLHFPIELSVCADSMCSNLEHRSVIDNLNNDIVNIICEASVQSKKVRKFGRGKSVVGWNKHVRDAHKRARQAYQTYLMYGKPDSAPINDDMYLTRKIFKSRLKYCQNHQDQLQMDMLASHIKGKNFHAF